MTFDRAMIVSIDETMVNAHGKALLIIFINKLPLIRFLLDSKAKTKEGIPIVKTLVNVI